jgi:hypothetical protein
MFQSWYHVISMYILRRTSLIYPGHRLSRGVHLYYFNILMGVSENSVPLNPMVLLIIIPIKWLFHWEYTQHFQTNPYVWVCLYYYISLSISYHYPLYYYISLSRGVHYLSTFSQHIAMPGRLRTSGADTSTWSAPSVPSFSVRSCATVEGTQQHCSVHQGGIHPTIRVYQ